MGRDERAARRRRAPSSTLARPGSAARATNAPDDPAQVKRMIGERVRAFRKARGLSVKALASAADVTPGFVSQVENAITMPSLTTLLRLCRALDVDAGDVFGTVATDGHVVRSTERRVFAYPDEGFCDELLSADRSARLEVLLSTIEPGCGSGDELYAHGTEAEFVHVLAGAIEIGVGGEWHELAEGDSITFGGATPHGFRNTSSGPAELIWVMTPAAY